MSKTQKLKSEQYQHINHIGGYLELQESDVTNNDLNRAIIKAYAQENSEIWLFNVNYYDEDRHQIINGEKSPLIKYEGEMIYDFEYTYCIPCYDDKIIDFIRQWNKNGAKKDILDMLYNRIDELGGLIFIWS